MSDRSHVIRPFTLLATLAFVAACAGDPLGAGEGAGAASAGGTAVGGGGAFAGEGASSTGAESADPDPCSPFAQEVVSATWGTGQSVGQNVSPSPALGPPLGGGCCTGSLDVVSLGNGGVIVLGFGDVTIEDGPGPDFIVIENAFEFGPSVFAELATVSVSDDGETWRTFPCTVTEAPYDSDGSQCAGIEPAYANADDNDIDPTDPMSAGGDAFDLADLGVSEARFVRIEDRPDLDGMLDGVFDLDAVAVINGVCEPR